MKSLGNVLIFGDSYSTFDGFIPEGYAVYYTENSGDNDVRRVEDTWWHMLLRESGSELVMNNSWSGSTVCYTGYGGYQPEQSFVYRAEKFLTDGRVDGKKIDTVLIFGGTNDFWNNSPVGEVKYSDWTDDDLRACVPAFCKLLSHIRTSSPEVRVINIVNADMKKEIAEGMGKACEHYGAECIFLHNLDLVNGHPTAAGMNQIKDQIVSSL